MQKRYYFLFIISLSIFVSSYFFILNYYVSDDILEYPIEFRVDEYVGFNLEISSLNLGTIPYGAAGERNFTIENRNERKVYVVLEKECEKNNCDDWIRFSENRFYLNGGERRTIISHIYVPKDRQLIGNYSGVIKAKFYHK